MHISTIALSILLVVVGIKDLFGHQYDSNINQNHQKVHTATKRSLQMPPLTLLLQKLLRFRGIPPLAELFPPAIEATPSVPALIPKQSQVAEMRKKLLDIMTDDMLGPWIELGFHECVGGCDGCVNLHLDPNKALTETVNGLLFLYEPFKDVVSYADFITLSVVVAADEAIERGGGTAKVGMRYGRKTCASPLKNEKVQPLPGGDDPQAVDATRFMMGLTVEETAALLGAHSVGKCHRSHQGYEGAWDLTPTKLDNSYFQSLLNTNWVAVMAPDVHKVQWLPEGQQNMDLKTKSPSHMMLHSDMGLKITFSCDAVNHIPTCKAVKGGNKTQDVQCQQKSLYLPAVEKYSKDNELFQKDFALVFQKVLEHQNNGLLPATP